MIKNLLKIIGITIAFALPAFGQTSKGVLELDPSHQLTLEEVYEVAFNERKVKLTQKSLYNIKQAHQAVMQMALLNKPIYGLTTGVGWNKDQPVFVEIDGKKVLSTELLELSKKFNISSLKAHALGLGKPFSREVVRAAMLIRLNTLVNGEAGVFLEVAKAYENFLNLGITPIVPSKGSVGEADITLASHIGLVMIGKWKAEYKGKIYPASEALSKAGLKPIELIGKDFLSILSNNSLVNAQAVLNVLATKTFYHQEIKLFALMLEGINGNVAPFSRQVMQKGGFEGLNTASKELRNILKGSDLWKISDKRALQDPLSFRTMNFVLGNVYDAIKEATQALVIQINRSDDNPMVILKAIKPQDSQLQSYFAQDKEGELSDWAIFPTANFNLLPVVLRIETLNIALARLSENITQQLIRISNPDLTKLPRFLAAPENKGHAFGAIEKPFVYSNITIKNLAMSQSFHTVVLAGDIEDVASMGSISVNNLGKILDNLYEIAAFQLLEGTQALDLRKDFHPSFVSTKIKEGYRKIVPFVQKDMIYTDIINKSIDFAKAIPPTYKIEQ